MPVSNTHNRSNYVKKGEEIVSKFTLAMSVAQCIGDAAAGVLTEQRKRWLHHNEDMKRLQKEFAATDRDAAKFFKEEAAHAMKFYRAACLLIPYVCAEYPGDCKLVDTYQFPPELFPYLVHLENLSTLEPRSFERIAELEQQLAEKNGGRDE